MYNGTARVLYTNNGTEGTKVFAYSSSQPYIHDCDTIHMWIGLITKEETTEDYLLLPFPAKRYREFPTKYNFINTTEENK